jgi:hypothetical protein
VSPYTAAAGDDCDDTAKDVHPGADEACNLADDDCDGKTDEDLGTLSCGVGTCAASVPACTGGVAGTCVPGKPGIETCNGLDDDCDGVTDEDLGTVSCGVGACAVLGPACRDGKAATCSPGTPAAETCDGTDDDCDGVTDEPDSLGCVPYWRDVDKDGAGGTVKPSKCLCGPDEDADYTATVAGDCDDLDNAVHPGAAEACNGRDDDCDGETDEGLGTVSCGVGVCAATVPACTDGKPGVCGPGKPGLEACDGRDDDCDGETDEGLGTLSCGVGVCAATVPACVGGKPGECVPGKPGPEACNDLDDDCDGATDEPDAAGCADRFQDADQDGFGEGDPACLCVPIGIYTASAGGDCDDADPAVSPGAAEACNGQDDDCDGMTDEADAVGCKVYGYDKDGDLHPDPTKGTKCLCGPAGYWDGTKSADCNDNDAGIHPDAAEVCNNGKDDDCDGNQDEEGASGCVDYWRDIDGDGYGSTLKPKRCLCAPDPVGDFVATQGGDCNDFDPLAHPKGQEACNGRDDDCDGLTDEGLAALCDDANPCTEDSCDPVKGCIHPAKPDKTACDDGNACTGGDVCLAGKCSGTGLTCDDNNPCTSDTCDVGLQKCVYTNHTNACDDGNRCTVGETCSAGKCGGGAALPCGDGNVCTTDSCDPATGCRYANNTLTCAVARCEGGKYLAATTCAAGACPAQVATSCDDGKVCTTDSCDAALGCLHANNLDVCAAAKCEGGKFFPAAMCSGGLCSNSVSTSCDDGNVCTTDTCDTTKGCMHANNTTTCTAPRCEGGKFFPTAICSGGTCPVQVGTTCDDGLSCSLDTCDPALGCVFTAGTQPLYDDFGTDSTSKFQGCFGFSLGWVPDGHITIQYKGSTGYGQYLATGWTAGEGTYTVKVREDDDANTFGAAILLKVSKTCSSGHKFIRYGIYHTTGEVIISKYNGSGTHLFKENRGIKANQWYKLTVVVSGSHYVFLLDDVPVFATEIQDPVFAGLMGVGLSIDDNYGKASKLVHFDDLAFTPAPLVRNGGFEEGFAGWSNGINPWGGSSYGQYTTSSEAHSGSVSIHSSIGQIVWQYLPLPCVPATTARFKWWVKGDCGIASGKYTTVFLQALDASGGILGEKQSKCFGNQPLWTEMSESMSLPSGMSKLLLAITSANGSGGYKTSAFLDDVSVEYLP